MYIFSLSTPFSPIYFCCLSYFSLHPHTTRYSISLCIPPSSYALCLSFSLSICLIFACTLKAWSIAFPSWPSLLLLLWACCIWLIPFLNAKWALLYTSPFLILFTTVLFLLEYISILVVRVMGPPLRNQSVLALPLDRLTQFPLLFLQVSAVCGVGCRYGCVALVCQCMCLLVFVS